MFLRRTNVVFLQTIDHFRDEDTSSTALSSTSYSTRKFPVTLSSLVSHNYFTSTGSNQTVTSACETGHPSISIPCSTPNQSFLQKKASIRAEGDHSSDAMN
ncbi:hypothetical protein UPYG_G00297850 [Umbra pygmaea]|uniref:Uncharacterized protein n=1 Tax=Umbra pygmaea TaxID=75934 RepID=A0ABD0WA88_UMBPY